MSAPKTFEHDTWLYHAAEAARLFLAGSEHPGDGWFDHPRDAPKADRVVSAGELVDAGVNLELLGRATEAEELLVEARSTVEALTGKLTEQQTKFDAAWADLTKAKQAADDENGDLRKTISSRDEDIRQLQVQVAELTTPPAKPAK